MHIMSSESAYTGKIAVITGAAGGMGATVVEVLAGDIGDSAYPARLPDVLAASDIGVLIHTAGLFGRILKRKQTCWKAIISKTPM